MCLSVLVCSSVLVTALAQNSPPPPANAPASQQTGRVASNVIEGIEFRGTVRVSQDSLKTLVLSKAGDVYDEKAVRRDFTALWNTKQFEDIQVTKEAGTRGGIIVRFVVTERP